MPLMKAVGTRVIAKPVKLDEIRYGNLVIPRTGIGDKTLWQVVQVGEEVRYVKPGDYIVAPVHVLQEITIMGEDYAVLKEEHVYAVLTHEEVHGAL